MKRTYTTEEIINILEKGLNEYGLITVNDIVVYFDEYRHNEGSNYVYLFKEGYLVSYLVNYTEYIFS